MSISCNNNIDSTISKMAIEFVNNSVGNSAGESKVKRRKKSSVKASMDPRIKSGRWTDAERRIFLKGLKQL